jgi:hypothetical protein
MTKEVLQSDQAHNAEVLALCPTENPVETWQFNNLKFSIGHKKVDTGLNLIVLGYT